MSATRPRWRSLAPVLPLLLLLLALLATIYSLTAQRQASAWVRHTEEVRLATGRLLTTIVDAETGQRGYLVTDDARFLEPYDRAVAEWNGQLNDLRQLTRDNPSQRDRLDELERLIRARFELLAITRGEREAGTAQALRHDMTRGEEVMDRLRGVLHDVDAEEAQLEIARIHDSQWKRQRTFLLLTGSTAALVLVVAGLWWWDRRNAEKFEAVSRERQLFAALVETSSDFIGIADPSGKPVYVNPAGRRMVGLPADLPVETTRIPDYYAPDQRAFASDVIVKGMVEEGLWKGETTFRHWQTQAAIPVSDTHFMIREPESGKVVGMGTITRDISEQKRVERERQFLSDVASVLASTIDYEETLAAVARLVIRDLADCCIIDVFEDGGTIRKLVADRDPSMAAVVRVLQHIDADPRRPRLGSRVLETKQPLFLSEVTAEYLASAAQSEEHGEALRKLAPRSLMAVPLMAHGRLLGALLFISRSPQRYQPHDLRLATELGARAALAVHNAHLYRTAVRATEARDAVLGVVAHDLRNPLNTIMMQAALLQRGRPEGERRSRRPGESIQRAAVRMNRLIEDLLDLTRIEAGQLAIGRGPVAAQKLALEVAEAEEALVASAGLELRLDVARDLPSVMGDPHRLLQVFENLVGNAIKFTPSGGRVTLGAARRDGEVLFWVENTGPRIPAEHLPHLFDRFWQAKRTDRRGAGLGLPIVKGIVEAHGGRVWVESADGRGTTFYFTIPVATGAEESTAVLLH